MDMCAGQDYAGAWHAERGICHRFVYDEHGKPSVCPERIVATGWLVDYKGHWKAVDACARHAPQLEKRPRQRR